MSNYNLNAYFSGIRICKHSTVLVLYIKIKLCSNSNSYNWEEPGLPAEFQPPKGQPFEIYMYAFMKLNNSFSTVSIYCRLKTSIETVTPPGIC